jgi:hypothetical protein
MNSKLAFILIASCLTLASCSSIPVSTQQTMPSVSQAVRADPALQPSQPGQPATMGDLYRHDNDLIQRYASCALKLQAAQQNTTEQKQANQASRGVTAPLRE